MDTAPETIWITLGDAEDRLLPDYLGALEYRHISVVERLEAVNADLSNIVNRLDAERDALLARVAELEDIDRQWGQTCAKALNERDAALARIAELESIIRGKANE